VRDLNLSQDLETALTANAKNLQRHESDDDSAMNDSGGAQSRLSESETDPQLLKSRIKELTQEIGIR
jgi:hypothetical protein